MRTRYSILLDYIDQKELITKWSKGTQNDCWWSLKSNRSSLPGHTIVSRFLSFFFSFLFFIESHEVLTLSWISTLVASKKLLCRFKELSTAFATNWIHGFTRVSILPNVIQHLCTLVDETINLPKHAIFAHFVFLLSQKLLRRFFGGGGWGLALCLQRMAVNACLLK